MENLNIRGCLLLNWHYYFTWKGASHGVLDLDKSGYFYISIY